MELRPDNNAGADRQVLALHGDLDLYAARDLRAALGRFIDARIHHVYLDMSGVKHIDSSCIAALIDAQSEMKPYGGAMALVGVPESVRGIFEIARLGGVFRVFPDLKAAAEELGDDGPLPA